MCTGAPYYRTLEVSGGSVSADITASLLADWATQQGQCGPMRLVGASFVSTTAVQAAGPIVVGFRLAGKAYQGAFYVPGVSPLIQPLDLPLEEGQILQIRTLDPDPLGTYGQIGVILYLSGDRTPTPCG